MDKQLVASVYVIKRNQKIEPFEIGKLLLSIQTMCFKQQILLPFDRLGDITSRFDRMIRMSRIISIEDLSKQFGQLLMHYQNEHYNFAKLAREVELNNLHKTTYDSFLDLMENVYADEQLGPLMSNNIMATIDKFGDRLEEIIDHDYDRKYTYFGLKILQESYLWRIGNKVVERPQHMLMRLAIAMFPKNFCAIQDTYESMAGHYFVPSDRILKYAGLKKPYYQNSFVLTVREGEKGLAEFLSRFQECLKFPGEIGIDLSQTTGENMKIPGTNYKSKGLLHLIELIRAAYRNITKKYRTEGSVAFYLEVWHKDIRDFVKLNTKKPGRKFYYNVIIPHEFMRRVYSGHSWSLLCPTKCPNLWKACDKEFDLLYKSYSRSHQYSDKVLAEDLWRMILECQLATGYPSIVFKDNINNPLGSEFPKFTINASNKYANMALFSTDTNIASAHSAFLILPTFIDNRKLDLEKLGDHIDIAIRFLNQVIDDSSYQTSSSQEYAHHYRPLSLGIHGLADLYLKIGAAYTRHYDYNIEIFEYIFSRAVYTSVLRATQVGGCAGFKSSQYFTDKETLFYKVIQKQYNLNLLDLDLWEKISADLKLYEIENSVLLSLKSDKITSQIMGVSNSFYPYESFVHRVEVEQLQDSFLIINEELMRQFIFIGPWTAQRRDAIIANHNCINRLGYLYPRRYKYVFDSAAQMDPEDLVDLAADRIPFIDQSQSFKLYLRRRWELWRYQTYSWVCRLKTIYKIIRPSIRIPCIKLKRNRDRKVYEDPNSFEDPKDMINLSELYVVEHQPSYLRF